MMRRLAPVRPASSAMEAPLPWSISWSSPCALVARRAFQAQYGQTMRTHRQMLDRYVHSCAASAPPLARAADGEQFAVAALPLLEAVEDRLALWKRQKWEFRTPALLGADDKAAATALLQRLQAASERFTDKRRAMLEDGRFVSELLRVPLPELRVKPRAWLHKAVAQLRLQGRTDEARALREAWLRMEALGGPDYDLLERLVFVYGLGKMGTFDRTFTNTITVAPQHAAEAGSGASQRVHGETGLVALDTSDPFATLLRLALINIPDVHLLYDFLGWNECAPATDAHRLSYGASLGEYIARCLKHQHPGGEIAPAHVLQDEAAAAGGGGGGGAGLLSPSSSSSQAILFGDRASRVYLMRSAIDRNARAAESMWLPHYALWQGPNLTLVSIAHPNKFLRGHQVPHKKQLEGMCRRSALVLGHSMADVRVRSLLLPPSRLDRRSLLRLHAALSPDTTISNTAGSNGSAAAASAAPAAGGSGLADLTDDEILAGVAPGAADMARVPPEFRGWVSLYQSDVAAEDEDYAAVSATKPDEEWYSL